MTEPKIDNRDDYENLVRVLAAKFAAEAGEAVSAKHHNKAKRQAWPHLSERLAGELVMR